MGFRFLLYFILLYILVIPRALSLPNYSGERDISFNLFKLGGGLIDSSVMKFSKCVPGTSSDGLRALVDDATQLDCNNHTEAGPFCKCVNLIAGAGKKQRESIGENLKKEYFQYLKNQPESFREFKGQQMLKEYAELLGLLGPNDSCGQEFRVEFGKLSRDASSSTSPVLVDSYDMANEGQRAIFGSLIAVGMSGSSGGISPFIDEINKEEDKKKHRAIEFLEGFLKKYSDYLKVLSDVYDPHTFDRRFLEYTNSTGVKFSKNFQRNFIKPTLTNLQLSYNGELAKEIRNNPKALSESIGLALQQSISEQCLILEEEYKDFKKGSFKQRDLDSESFEDYLEVQVAGQPYDPDHKLSYESFVKNTIYSDNPTEFVNKRFEADIYYCDRKKLTSDVYDVISETIKDEENFEELNSLLLKDTELSNQIKNIEIEISDTGQMIHKYDRNIREERNKLRALEIERDRIERDISSGKLTPQEVQAQKHQLANINANIAITKNRLTFFQARKDGETDILMTKTNEVASLVNERNGVKSNMTELLDGNEDAVDQLLGMSRQSIYSGPEVVTYDSRTESFKYNKNFFKENKGFKEDRFSKLKSIEGFSEAEAKLAQTGKKTISKLFDPKKVVAKEKKTLKINPFNTKKVKSVSRAIQELPKENLSVREREIQKRLSDLDAYEKRISSKIDNFQASKAPVKSNKRSKREQSITDLRREIESVRKEREDFSSRVKKINVERESISQGNIPQVIEDSSVISSADTLSSPISEERIPTRIEQSVANNIESTSSSIRPIESVSTSNVESRDSKTNDSSTKGRELANQTVLDESNIFNDTVLSESDFSELSESLDPELLEKYEIIEGEYFSVDTSSGRIVYNPIFKDGKIVRFEKIKELTRSEVIAAHEEEVVKVEKMRYEVIKHADLMNIFTDIIKK